MEDLKTQTEQRLIQAIKESNLDNISLNANTALIQALTNLLSILYYNRKKVDWNASNRAMKQMKELTEKRGVGVCRRRAGSFGRTGFSVISHTNSIFF